MYGRWQRRLVAVLAASVAAVAVRATVAEPATSQPTGADAPTTGPAGAAGVAVSTNNPSSPDLRAVQQTLGRLADAESKAGHAADFLALLSKANREDVGPIDPVAWGDVDREIERFRLTWQGQFGSGFDLNDKEAFVFAEPNVRMLRGVDRATVLAQARKMASTPAQIAAIEQAPRGETATSAKAVVMLRAEGSAKPLALFVVNEKDAKGQPAWRVEVSGRVTGPALHDSLLRHLRTLSDTRASWPSNIDQGYSFAAHHLLAAITEAGEPDPATR